MTREGIHHLFLQTLFASRPRRFERVRVVSRLCNSRLLGAKNARRVFLFIPDFHLLSESVDFQVKARARTQPQVR